MAVGDGKGGMAHTERRQRARTDSLVEVEGTEGGEAANETQSAELSEEEEEDEREVRAATGKKEIKSSATGVDELVGSMAALRFVPPSVTRGLKKDKPQMEGPRDR